MWAPLQGFKYGPFANLRLQVTGPQASTVAPVLLIPRDRSPGAEGGGAPGAAAAAESSLTSP